MMVARRNLKRPRQFELSHCRCFVGKRNIKRTLQRLMASAAMFRLF